MPSRADPDPVGESEAPSSEGGGSSLDGKEVARLGEDVLSLSRHLSQNYSKAQRLIRLLEQVNTGLLLDETLDFLYGSFRPTIPYNRLELLLLEGGAGADPMLRPAWRRRDGGEKQGVLSGPYPLGELRMSLLLESGMPQIVGDVSGYIAANPWSPIAEELAVDDCRSALITPLIALGRPVGILVFGSRESDAYDHDQGELLLEIGGPLAQIIEKSRLYQRLVQLMDDKNRFLGIAAHDLRNPIGVIQGYAEMLGMEAFGALNAQQREMTQVIKQCCKGMLGLIDDLLDVSAIESGKLEFTFREVSLRPFLVDFHRHNGLLAQAKGIELTIDLPPQLPTVSLDRVRIEQVLGNLLSNAIKFSSPGTRIVLAAREADGGAEVSVTDQGPGISDDDLQRLFQEFQRASARPTGGEKSTGLGLAIVKRLVAAHRGRLFVHSQLGEGSTFGFWLPAATRG